MFGDDLFTSNNVEMVKGFLEKFKELCPGKNPADGLQIQVMLLVAKVSKVLNTAMVFLKCIVIGINFR